MQEAKDFRSWITDVIKDKSTSSENSLGDGTGEPAWREPLVAFASGADPIFEDFKTHVGALHWTPAEIFENLTVISWVLPQTEATKRDNAGMNELPARRWARSRIFGEQFNSKLRSFVQDTLNREGYPAVAPFLSTDFHTESSEAFQITSTWSERHAAYACGHGTFGLCDGLITRVGKAMRLGSVVVEAQVTPDKRPYTNHREYCAFAVNGTCGECIDRCPAGALSKDGHDKALCKAYLREITAPYVENEYGFQGYGCGLCQTGVPCESGIPNLP